MKKVLGILALGFLLTGCSDPIASWEHYRTCSSTYSSFSDIASCGKQTRINYLYETKQQGSEGGNRYVQWVDLLNAQVQNGEISEAAAKLKVMEREEQLMAQQRAAEIRALESLSQSLKDAAKALEPPKQTNCRTTGTTYGGTVTANTNCTTW